MPDKWAQYAVGKDKWAQYAQPATVAGAGPLGLPQPKNPTVNMQPSSSMVPAALTAGDLGLGALKGAGRTANNIGKLLVPDVALKAAGVSTPGRSTPPALESTNTAQKIGGGLEQAAEFFIPGGAEEAAYAKLAPYVGKAAPLLRAGLAAASSGAVNKAQGGSFTAGAVAGGIGSGVAQGARAAAPSIAESALKVLAPMRKHGRTIGRAVLDDTVGLAPATVRDSASNAVQKYTDELQNAASASTVPFSLAPARQTIQDAVATATSQNSPLAIRDLVKAQDQLHYLVNPNGGSPAFLRNAPIPSNVTPVEGLQFKRGIGHLVDNWDKTGGSPASGPIKQAYGALDAELDRTVPGAADINQKISSLLPAVSRADMAAHSAPTTQQMFHRLAVPTGAMAVPMGMGAYGYEKGGIGGAAKGFVEGMAIPLLAASPTGQMALARGLNSQAMRRLVLPFLGGAALQATRSTNDNPDQ